MKRRAKPIRVLDFSHLLPGEYCSTLLADVGFDVVRIEPQKPGLNRLAPPVVQGESLYYWSVHRAKSCIQIDLKHPQGQKLARKLARQVDVIVENFSPGTMERLGLDYDRLSRKNRGLVYCSISAYGQSSARRNVPAHDLNLQAEAGLLLAGREPDEEPAVPGVLTVDYATALSASTAILGALFLRQATGRGQHLDISMLQSAAQMLAYRATAHIFTDQLPREGGFDFPRALPNYAVYRCRDGRHLAVACVEPQFWRNFCDVIGLEDARDWTPTFDEDGKELRRRVERIIRKKSQSRWLELFEGRKCCVSPVKSLQEALADADFKDSAMVGLNHETLGPIAQMKAFQLSGSQDRRPGRENTGNGDRQSDVLKSFGIKRKARKRLVDLRVLS